MSVLVDTSFLFALKNLDDENHSRAVELYRELFRGRHGVGYTTNLIFAEAVTVALARSNRHSAAVSMGELLLRADPSGPRFSLHHLTPAQLNAAWDECRRHRDKSLSMTDWTSIVVARDLEIAQILSFDAGFDGLYARLA